MISCILLSAGLSQRFGSPKALAQLGKTTVINHLQKLLIRSKVDEIIIVLGAHAKLIKPHLLKHSQVKFVYNKDYIFGQTSSFKAGLQAASKDAQGLMLLPVDYPLVHENTINMIVQSFLDIRPLIVVPAYNGKKGHPPIFSNSLRNEIFDLDNKRGLNSIMYNHQSETTILPIEDPGILATFNTEEEFKSLILPKQN